jgi:putative FmdB family regulatory protein
MPIYEYQCEKCGTFEVTQKITESPLRKCPTCKSKVKKLISNTSFQLKGTGWYITDYARKDKSVTKKDNGAAKALPETKKETKTETSSKSGEKSSSTSSSTSAS